MKKGHFYRKKAIFIEKTLFSLKNVISIEKRPKRHKEETSHSKDYGVRIYLKQIDSNNSKHEETEHNNDDNVESSF